MALVRQTLMKLFKQKSEERRTCLKLKQNIPQFCKLIVVLMKKIKRAICCYMKRAMCGYMTTTWLRASQGFLRGEHLYRHHELTFVCVAFYSLEATNICFATQYVTNSVYFPLTCLFTLVCKTVCDRHLENPFHTARHHRVEENSSRRLLPPSSRLGRCV